MPTLGKPRKRHRTKLSVKRRPRSAACFRSSKRTEIVTELAPITIPPTNIVRSHAFSVALPDNKQLLTASGVVDLGLNAVSREDELVIVPVEFTIQQDRVELLFGLDATLSNSTLLIAPNSINTFNRNPSEVALINGEVRLLPTPDETAKHLFVTAVARVRGASMGRFGYTISALIIG
ncbi:hypothetical protein DFQ01_109191 [Paenibacillus cellulosilyticus]|uniref:Uncharacterized protein n=1 Tax=Paenibacillus cellulosilyticus TaxID=375489 RepID=A0A2V2YUG3_9BACL|nr:hypothetical protein [Paenibacillus cellulosilyticus]PWW02566.1 hypothetical protein DFQ01_109191 [Paenibacillus cellulosilyticus]QKS47257.1 hypothetical protein HUB94_22745 [Paenibacillus cellulosilyticus]